MPTTIPAERAPAVDAVRRWRFTQLIRAGYSPSDALTLSRRDDVDLHRATQLLAEGCPPETALRILL